MQVSEFDFDLPEDLIAQYPPSQRTDSRLLCLDREDGTVQDRRFVDIESWLGPDDVLVVNDTRVVEARLFAIRPTGGRVEILIERLLDGNRALAQARSSKPVRAGEVLECEGGAGAKVLGRRGEFVELEFGNTPRLEDLLSACGHMPLPPYIRRRDEAIDRSRYQTVYARRSGAVAAPTAGLHFDEPLLTRLRARGVEVVPITLHVGAGTFQPLRVAQVGAHVMHPEVMEVSPQACERIAAARARGGRVFAVGTTSVRALESACGVHGLGPLRGETSMFIYPGFEFRVVDALLTNFHLPRSTLLMLVCAFAGTANVLNAYRHAIDQRYRFYSYGDAMLITGGGRDHAAAGR